MGPLPPAALVATAADAAEPVTTGVAVPQAGARLLERRRWCATWLCGACPAACAVQLLPEEQQCPSCRAYLMVRLRNT